MSIKAYVLLQYIKRGDVVFVKPLQLGVLRRNGGLSNENVD